ncbi:hypothetical protein CEXT_14581 [Caerostris extrusa]|uniref:Uncharacterized protein n=1 Tax=Caerostris extrusa TaxID=172846 RepID=A0AAV4MGQ2_CAEEX|nr:hypothetical protein CEXT_14581 [Caerostris extrusa]
MESAEIYDKNVNTFRFLRKRGRIKKVDVSTFRQEDKFLCTPDGKTTYFSEAFEKWRERNYSISYEEFRKDIERYKHWKNLCLTRMLLLKFS